MRRITALAALLAIGLSGAVSTAIAQNAKPAEPAQGAPGHNKDDAASPKGEKGEKGDKGDKGEKGEKKSAESGLIGVGETAPDWALKDAQGKVHRLSDYKGKVVVLDFWATWCGPCKKAMPSVQKVHEKFKDKGVVVIGVATWEKDGDPAAYMKEKGFNYNLLLKGDDVAKSYRVKGIPTFYIIGGDGKVVFSESGFDPSDESKIEKVIEKHLASGKV